jgi:putative tricarboxylic transport membrane protein
MRVNDAVIGLIAILVGIGVFWHVQTFPSQGGHPGPALFPGILAVLMIGAGIALIVKGLRAKQPWFQVPPELDSRGVGNIVAALAGVAFYIIASETLGFLVTASCIMFCLMLLLKARAVQALPVALCMAVFLYALFNKGLLVPLPRGLIAF